MRTVEVALARRAYQDGGQFYDDETGELIADYGYMVHDDQDVVGAQRARANFLTMHTEYSLD